MYWSLLPVAAIFFWLALRTPSVLLMVIWLLLTMVCLLVWGYLHYRRLFPAQESELQITPLDKEQLELMRQQKQAETPAKKTAGNIAASTPVPSPIPTQAPAPMPAPVERPITGRAVFILPDDEPPPNKHTPPQ
ncbi:hypothetical protein CO613_08265 [Lysobacteraceae bacterium NML07-0707]|nr:hypothetical protein CO613_08265 [Xanthomonadaceae bacterium NML07-0707]